MRVDVGIENSLFIHVTYVPYIAAAGELKSKPTQHSVKELREIGIQPDILVCRCEKFINSEMKSKIGLFCSVRPENVIAAYDASTIYAVPLMLQEEELDLRVIEKLQLELAEPRIAGWRSMVETLKQPKHSTTIGIVGKYVDLKESYKSLNEAMVHGGIANHAKVNLVYIDSEKLDASNVGNALKGVDSVLVPGGFGERGVSGKIVAIRYARENNVPFFGICYGMQLAAIEFARNVCGLKDATSREFADIRKGKRNLVVDFMDEQRGISQKGGTMRLGAYPCSLEAGSLAHKIYKQGEVMERHRHRYEFNNKFRALFQKKGMVLSGICRERDLVEIIELKTHSWFLGVQFHPEFRSKPMQPHPLFTSFVEASIRNSQKGRKKRVGHGKKNLGQVKSKASSNHIVQA